ncbi:Ig-like domain-containing protein [Microbacterium horticulturae]|uniref:Ig-like domain-containing protein n=1 Tax=Microbacterium horticulturae TaxID=3028316 RepID=A0ABY8BZ00_9MICO|nr:Ig-like domain-containing protein [Microbacterium sp. KACC 23027]WEG09430.1 Ig-like domain-containing protein [Microbacterium sp. KACC 23027]
MKRGSLIATVVAVAAAAASVIAVSVVWPGLDSRSTPPEQTSVWALQTGEGRRYARVNTSIGELDTVRSVANPSAVAQTGDGAYLFSESYGKVTRIDEALPDDLDDEALRESPSTPAGTVQAAVTGDYVAYRTDSGAVYAGRMGDASPGQLNPDGADPDAPQFTAQAIAVDDAGVVYAYSQKDAVVVRYRISDGEVLGRDAVPKGPSGSALGLTAADGTWFLVDEDAGRLWRRGAESSVVLSLVGDIAYSQAQSSGDAAWIADDTGLVKLSVDGAEPERVVGGAGSTRDLGTPARPVVDGGVVFAAWVGTDTGTLWRSDDGEQALDFGDKTLGDDRRPVFTGSGSALILNETRSGWVWNAHTAALLPSSQDWSLDDTSAPETAPSDEEAQVVIDPKPPVAEADAFGVRAGSLVSLPVMLNDHDPNEDVLTIDADSVTGLDDGFGTLSVTDDGQRLAVHVAADAHGSATFRYRVTDGTAKDGLYSEPATATLTVRGSGDNSAPKWCGTAGCLATWPSPQVAPGGTVTVPVLDGWVDPDGDPLMLLGVTDPTGAGAAASTPDGDVVYQHSDPSVTEAQIVQLKVTVGDTRGATTTRDLTVRITPKPKLEAESFAVTETQGGGITVDVGPYVQGTQGRLSLSSVRVLDDTSAEAVATAGGTSFDMSTKSPGIYRVSYTVTDGESEASATARVTVLPDDAPAQLATSPVVAFVRPQQDVTLDVFSAVSNPTGRVLLLSDIEPHAIDGATMSVDAVGQNYLRISGSTADGSPGQLGTITYTVSDGTNDAGARITGEATVYLLPASSDLAPIAVDDTVVARAGAQVDIPVLDNDVSASGGAMTLNPASVRSSTKSALAFASGRMLRYLAPRTPGDYRIEYSVFASGSPTLADTAVVRVKVISDEANRAPRPRTLTGRVLTGQATTIPFRSYGVDPDGDDVSLDRILTQPSSGSATIAADGESIEYASVPGFHGQVSFTYRVVDAAGMTGTATVRVGVLDEQANPSPVTFTDYVQLQVGESNTVRVEPLANDVDPTGGALALSAVRPDAVEKLADGSDNAEYARLKALIGETTEKQVVISAGTSPGTMSFLYDVTSSTGNTARGLIVVKVVRGAVPDYPVISDTVLTAVTREQFTSGVDVVAGKVSWTGGDIGGLTLSLWGEPEGVSVSGTKLSGALPEHTRIIPFALSGTSTAGQKVTSYGFLRIPGADDLTLALKPGQKAQEVTEGDSVTFDMAKLVSLPTGAVLEVGDEITATKARKNAVCASAGGTKVRYDAGLGAPWTDACVVPVRMTGQKEWTYLSVPIAVTALDPVPVLDSASLTISPGATVTYDLKKLTTWQGRDDWDNIVYTLDYQGRDFTVTHEGTTVTIVGADAAAPGDEEVAVVGVSSHPGVSPARLILRVGAVPSTLPKAGTVAQKCSQANGSSCTVEVIGAAGEVNPLPNTPLELVDVRSGGTCSGVTFTVADAAHIRASWSDDTAGQTCTAVFSVRDAQGRATAGDRDGQLMLDLHGYPKAPAAVVQSAYADGTITLRVDAGAASQAYPELTGFVVRYKGDVVARCSADGVCPTIEAPNGEARQYEAKAVNAVGESSGSVSTTAWAYDAPPTPKKVTATPVVTSGDGGVVKVTVDGIDSSKTAKLRITSDTGESVDVDVPRRGTSVTVPEYRIGSNDSTPLTVTPMSPFTLPPGFDGSTTGQARTILANGVGAPKNPSLSLSTSSDDSDKATIKASGSATPNGAGSRVLYGIVLDGDRCVATDSTAYKEFEVDAGRTYTYRLCAESFVGDTSFGRVETTEQTIARAGNGPKGYTYTVAAKPSVDDGAQRAEWKIKDDPTSAEQVPRWASVKFSGLDSSVFDRDPGIEVWYDYGIFSGPHSPVTANSASAPYQVWAQWQIKVCSGGDTLQATGSSSGNAATVSFDYSKATYEDVHGKSLDVTTAGVVPDYAVSVARVSVTVSWPSEWGLNSATSTFGGSCAPKKLAAPTISSAEGTADGVVVTWSSVADATAYELQRYDGGWSTVKSGIAETTYTDGNADFAASAHKYRVIASNAHAESSASETVTSSPYVAPGSDPGDGGGDNTGGDPGDDTGG